MNVNYTAVVVFGHSDAAETHRVGLQTDDGLFYLARYVVLETGAYLLTRTVARALKLLDKEAAKVTAEVLAKRLNLPVTLMPETYEMLMVEAAAMLPGLIDLNPCLGALSLP